MLYDSDPHLPGRAGTSFWNLPPEPTMIKEGVPCGRTCWVQTVAVRPQLLHHHRDGRRLQHGAARHGFGNVCKRCVKGYTMGFWSNKNGKQCSSHAPPSAPT